MRTRPRSALWAATLAAASVLAAAAAAPPPAEEWRFYGRDPGGQRFSPLKHINRNNVARLETAWVYHTKELELGLEKSGFAAAFSATPIVVDGVMYFSTPSSRVIALDAETGRELWTHDPQRDKKVREFNAHRGVSYWEGGGPAGPDKRIFSGTVDGRLLALDAVTGRPRSDFGTGGAIDLRQGEMAPLESSPSWGTRLTSPPVIYKDLVITGWTVQEYPGLGPSGDVRAYDARTGRPVWRFNTVPRPGQPGHDTWEGESWKDRSGANVWSVMSLDAERGLLFLPVGSPAYDFWGGDRKGRNLYGNSIVALEAATGKLLWHFQTVHHDIWDYDLPAQPVLLTLRRDGRDVPAVAQVTKMGFVFVFDRLTGAPLFPVEERPVPASDVPGEAAFPTQPFPLAPPPFARQNITRDEVSRVTPESHEYCLHMFDNSLSGPIYTPTSTRSTISFPGFHGGANWSGASVDPESGRLFVNTNDDGVIGQLLPQKPDAPMPWRRGGSMGEYGWFRDKNGWPCQQPPWGSLVAIDLAAGTIAWKVPLGVVEKLVERGLPPTGTQNLGGSIATAGGLVFVAATLDRRLRAFDTRDGRELWAGRLEANGHATPMTYRGRSGRQFVVVAAGGGGFLRELSRPLGDALMAFALPAAPAGSSASLTAR